MLPVEPMDFAIKTGVGASSRHFKKAVDRNRIKRLLREAYRTEKNPLYECLNTQQKQITLFFLYIDKFLPEKSTIKSIMPQIIERLVKKINETAASNT